MTQIQATDVQPLTPATLLATAVNDYQARLQADEDEQRDSLSGMLSLGFKQTKALVLRVLRLALQDDQIVVDVQWEPTARVSYIANLSFVLDTDSVRFLFDVSTTKHDYGDFNLPGNLSEQEEEAIGSVWDLDYMTLTARVEGLPECGSRVIGTTVALGEWYTNTVKPRLAARDIAKLTAQEVASA